MAIVNFSVPDDVKKAFDKALRRQNKSAVIAELMRQAVSEAQLRQRRMKLFHELTARRAERPEVTSQEPHAHRIAGRP